MGIMRSKIGLLTVLGAMFGFMGSNDHERRSEPETEKVKKKRVSDRKEGYKKVLADQGVISWTIDGITVQARNEENALRKVNNIKKRQLNGAV